MPARYSDTHLPKRARDLPAEVWREVEAQVSLSSDAVFADDGGARQLGTVTGSVAEGYQVTLAVRIDPSTAASADGLSDGSPPAAPPPGGAPRALG